MTAADQDHTRLLCAWCGEPLSAVEVTLHTSSLSMERWGWHPGCMGMDPLFDKARTVVWPKRRAIIEARGPGRVGKIVDGAP